MKIDITTFITMFTKLKGFIQCLIIELLKKIVAAPPGNQTRASRVEVQRGNL